MEVLILGSGTGVPHPARSSASILVRVLSRRILIDFGPGTLRRLAEESVDWQALDAVLLTHLHPDHTLDLWSYCFATHWPGYAGRRRVTLVAPLGLAGLKAGLTGAYGHYVWPKPGVVEERLIDARGRNRLQPFPGLIIETAPAAHSSEALSYRLEAEGLSLVYTGDTGFSEEVVRLSRGADLLITDCSLPEGEEIDIHQTPSLAGRLAREAGVGRLVLTHLYPETDGTDLLGPALAEFGGEVIVARDGLRLKL